MCILLEKNQVLELVYFYYFRPFSCGSWSFNTDVLQCADLALLVPQKYIKSGGKKIGHLSLDRSVCKIWIWINSGITGEKIFSSWDRMGSSSCVLTYYVWQLLYLYFPNCVPLCLMCEKRQFPQFTSYSLSGELPFLTH